MRLVHRFWIGADAGGGPAACWLFYDETVDRWFARVPGSGTADVLPAAAASDAVRRWLNMGRPMPSRHGEPLPVGYDWANADQTYDFDSRHHVSKAIKDALSAVGLGAQP